jgi:hypothetical protein
MFSLSPCAFAISLQADKHSTYEKEEVRGQAGPFLDLIGRWRLSEIEKAGLIWKMCLQTVEQENDPPPQG